MTPRIEDLHNWLPIRVYWRDGGPWLDWCYMGEERLTEPFFDNSITLQLTKPFSVLFRHQTPIDLLRDLVEQAPCLAPTGFIFHMSRCGSTLVSQMLAKSEQNIVVSEAQPIDTILRSNIVDPSVTDEQRITWLRGLIGAYSRKRTGGESGFFIKWDSWNTLEMDLIDRAFPGVPWVFLYRNPIEVMVSHMKQPGVQMMRGAIDRLLPGLPVMEALQMPSEEYSARVLAGFCETALDRSESKNAMLVEYTELPGAVLGRIFDHFGLSFSGGEIEKMKLAATFDAKRPGISFAPDGETKRASASETARRAAEVWVDPLYQRLRARQKEIGS